MEQNARQKEQNGLVKLLARVLVLGISAQILLGIFWIICSFASFREYGESAFLLKAKESLVLDEYEGILYVLAMKASSAVAGLFSMPWYCPLYFLQLLAAGGSAHLFLRVLPAYEGSRRPVKLWAVLAFMTFPAAAQSHLAVLPISFASSAFLASLGLILRQKGEKKGRWDGPAACLSILGAAYLVEMLLWPKFGFFGALLLLLYAIYEILFGKNEAGETGARDGKRVFLLSILTAAFLGLVPVIYGLTVREGAHGRTYDTVQAAALRRYAWHDLAALYPEWPAELKDALSQEEIALLGRFPGEIPQILGKVDATYGKEKARSIYGALAKVAHQRLFRQNAGEIIKDEALYAFTPASDLFLMASSGHETLERRNLEQMRRSAPLLADVYVKAGGFCFLAMLLFVAFGEGKTLWGKSRRERWNVVKRWTFFWILGAAFVLYFTYQGGGIMDAKCVLVLTAFWLFAGVGNIFKALEK